MAGQTRSYTGGHFLLELDGYPAIVKDVDGGTPSAEVGTVKMGPEIADMKHISTVKFEPFTINVGMSMGKSLYQWIKASLDLKHMRKSGAVIAANFNYEAMQRRDFRDALITEFTVPALDAGSKDNASFTVKFDPEQVMYSPGDGSKIKGEANVEQKKWLCSNFRLRLDPLDCTKVNKIDSFTMKQGVVQDDVGEQRIATKEPSKFEFPNLSITLAKSSEQSWRKWFEDFVIKGNNGQENELTGAIEILDPSLQKVLATIDLFQVGIFKITDEKIEAGKDGIARIKAELYVEKMGFTLH